jgi:hypothetical protein
MLDLRDKLDKKRASNEDTDWEDKNENDEHKFLSKLKSIFLWIYIFLEKSIKNHMLFTGLGRISKYVYPYFYILHSAKQSGSLFYNYSIIYPNFELHICQTCFRLDVFLNHSSRKQIVYCSK